MDGVTATVLPDADWRHRAGLVALTDVLGADAGMARFVGGAVRDTLLGLPVRDVDLATCHAPETVMTLLRDSGIRVVPTGLAHGTVTAVLESGPVEVTTLRHDLTTDGRHATVAFTGDYREDAARRDFTINALYADPPSGSVFDYFDGLDDLAARRVRFIGDPFKRIAEDHLRILRFFRFLARFGDAPDPDGLAACAARARDLMALSRERIADEMLKLLVARDAVGTTALMLDQGIFAPVVPEITAEGVDRLARVAEYEAAAGLGPDPIRRLAALMPHDAAIGDTVAARLKLSNAQRKRIAAALGTGDYANSKAMAYALGREGAVDRAFLTASDSEAAMATVGALSGWEIPRLPLTGGALIERGLRKGPDVARALRMVEERWVAEGFPDDYRVARLADSVVEMLLRSTNSA